MFNGILKTIIFNKVKLRKISKIIVFLLFISCNRHDKENSKNNMKIDKFDVQSFETFIEKGGNTNSLQPYILEVVKNDTIIKKSVGVFADSEKKEYQEQVIPPIPNLFYTIKLYDENGNKTQEISHVFFGNLKFDYGNHIYFKKNGEIDRKKNFETDFKNYKIKLDDLLNILSSTPIKISEADNETIENVQLKLISNFDQKKKNYQEIINKIAEIHIQKESFGKYEKNIINPSNRFDIERISISKDDENVQWIVTKDYSTLGRIEYVVGGLSGKILKSKYILH